MKAAGLLLFLVLATANSGGYRYGVSDQAYYLPAISQALTPDLFPRDTALLHAQSQLIASDDLIAGVVRTSGVSLPAVAAAAYILSLVVLLLSAASFARGLRYSWWAVTLFGILLTFRHRIAKTGANSLEGYMHPRQLAFAAGVAALACLVRGRQGLALGLVAASAVLHPTTALFFGLLVGVSILVSRPAWRVPLGTVAGVAGLAAVWAVTAGPLASRLRTMDPDWLGVLAGKDYLFPAQWPLDAWLLNLAYPIVIVAVWRARVRAGVASSHEAGLVAGLMALLVVFLMSVPLTMWEVALAVQLQVTRVFWILDFAAIAAVSWWLAQHRRVAIGAIAVCALASAGRGYYILEVAQPERALVQFDLPDTPWMDAMRWLNTQPRDWHVLADPGHAYKYGISVRVGANRDTVLESVKDSALAMYDRDVAMRVKERTLATNDYDQLSLARVRRLDDQYDLDAIIVEAAHMLDLPLLYRNAEFAIYDVR